jgi:hypothetical protein
MSGKDREHTWRRCPDQLRGADCTRQGKCKDGCIGGNGGRSSWGAPTREEAEAELARKGLARGQRMRAWEE